MKCKKEKIGTTDKIIFYAFLSALDATINCYTRMKSQNPKKRNRKKNENKDLLDDPTNELHDRMILLSPRRRPFKLDDTLSGLF